MHTDFLTLTDAMTGRTHIRASDIVLLRTSTNPPALREVKLAHHSFFVADDFQAISAMLPSLFPLATSNGDVWLNANAVSMVADQPAGGALTVMSDGTTLMSGDNAQHIMDLIKAADERATSF